VGTSRPPRRHPTEFGGAHSTRAPSTRRDVGDVNQRTWSLRTATSNRFGSGSLTLAEVTPIRAGRHRQSRDGAHHQAGWVTRSTSAGPATVASARESILQCSEGQSRFHHITGGNVTGGSPGLRRPREHRSWLDENTRTRFLHSLTLEGDRGTEQRDNKCEANNPVFARLKSSLIWWR
jgi:hypothetical protein